MAEPSEPPSCSVNRTRDSASVVSASSREETESRTGKRYCLVCFAASTMIRRHRSPRSLSETFDRAARNGMMRVTPTSTAFSRIHSKAAVLIRACTRIISATGGGTVRSSSTRIVVVFFSNDCTFPDQTLPRPSKTSTLSPTTVRDTIRWRCSSPPTTIRSMSGSGSGQYADLIAITNDHRDPFAATEFPQDRHSLFSKASSQPVYLGVQHTGQDYPPTLRQAAGQLT